jgi:hypothetical protein
MGIEFVIAGIERLLASESQAGESRAGESSDAMS